MAAIYRSSEGAHRIRERYLARLRQWPVAHERLRLPTCHGETFVITSGARHLPPLVLLHGSGSNSSVWSPEVAHWCARFRVYAVDLIGEPGMSAPSRPPLPSDAYARWLDDVLAALDVERTHLLGMSLGGWVALDYATRRPERIERLVLICPSGVGRQRLSFALKAIPLLLLGDAGRRKALALASGPEGAGGPYASDALLTFKHFRPRMGAVPRFTDDALRRLTMPVMLIAGAQDALLDSRGTLRRLQRLVPHLHARYLTRAGHVITGQTDAIQCFLLAMPYQSAEGAGGSAQTPPASGSVSAPSPSLPEAPP